MHLNIYRIFRHICIKNLIDYTEFNYFLLNFGDYIALINQFNNITRTLIPTIDK